MADNGPIEAESVITLTGGGLPAPLKATFGDSEVILAVEDAQTGWGKVTIPRRVFQRLVDLMPYERDLEQGGFDEPE